MFDLARCRELIGAPAAAMTDAEILELRDYLYEFVHFIADTRTTTDSQDRTAGQRPRQRA